MSEEKLALGFAKENKSIVCSMCGLRFLPSKPKQTTCNYCKLKPKTRNLDAKVEPINHKSSSVGWLFVKGVAVVLLTLAITYVMEYLVTKVAKIGVA